MAIMPDSSSVSVLRTMDDTDQVDGMPTPTKSPELKLFGHTSHQ